MFMCDINLYKSIDWKIERIDPFQVVQRSLFKFWSWKADF